MRVGFYRRGSGCGITRFCASSRIETNLGSGQWWSVPFAVLLDIPLYANATGVIPVLESLATKGLPIGTILASCMSTVAARFPKYILLKQVMTRRLLAIIFTLLRASFTVVGVTLNAIN
jgi:uncharacterized membrane protein YraQ (UPF0718 family)